MQGVSLNDFMLLANGSTSFSQILLSMGLAALLSVYLFFFYRINYVGVLYSRSFNLSLVVVTVVVCTIMMIIGSNLALSLGMVGALSIIRYRSAIKEPLDTGYLFWAVVNGLGCGAGSYKVIIVGNVVLSILLYIFLKIRKTSLSYLLTVRGKVVPAQEISEIMKRYASRSSLKLKSIYGENREYVFEVKVVEDSVGKMLEEIKMLGSLDTHITSFDNESPV